MNNWLRTGIGFDAHRFADVHHPKPCMVATLQWDGIGLEGESDGDVAVHAIIDALLAAAHLGDIGTLFGVGADAQGAGMSGTAMLRQTVEFLREHRCNPHNISVCVIGNRPKISQRREEAEQQMSRICGCDVSLTATTTDAMGFTGRSEGIAAMATALIEKRS